MKYSGRLNGFWEEGYHFYLEFNNGVLTVRNYRRELTLETKISYDSRALERGDKTEIKLEDCVLSRTYTGGMMTQISGLYYENGELKLKYLHSIMGETLYTLRKVDHGPFAHIIIRDDEVLDSIQGKWFDRDGSELIINENKIHWLFADGVRFHAVSYTYDPDRVFLVPENLIDNDFSGFTRIEVQPGKLTTTMIIHDVNTPPTVFLRRKEAGQG